MSLSDAELRRYSRHLSLPEIGVAGQEKLQAANARLLGTVLSERTFPIPETIYKKL